MPPADCSWPKIGSRRIARLPALYGAATLGSVITSPVPRAAGAREARPIPAANLARDSTEPLQGQGEQVHPFRWFPGSKKVIATAHLQHWPPSRRRSVRARVRSPISCVRIKTIAAHCRIYPQTARRGSAHRNGVKRGLQSGSSSTPATGWANLANLLRKSP